jgi:phage FluMu gp28-like protein
MAFRLKTAMQSECFWMPKDEDIVSDFSSIERAITDGGQTKLSAPRSSSGHGDRFWAAALALHAAGTHRPFELVMAV